MSSLHALAEGGIVREAHIMQYKTPDDSPVWPAEELVPGFKCEALITACPTWPHPAQPAWAAASLCCMPCCMPAAELETGCMLTRMGLISPARLGSSILMLHASVHVCSKVADRLHASCARREVTREFLAACPPVVDRIMSAFALGLGLPEDYFKEVGGGFSLNMSELSHKCLRTPELSGLLNSGLMCTSDFYLLHLYCTRSDPDVSQIPNRASDS